MPIYPVLPEINAREFTIQPTVTVEQLGGGAGAVKETAARVDLTTRLHAFSIRASLNDPTVQADVTFSLGRGLESLSPLVSTSRRFVTRPVFQPHNLLTLGVGFNHTALRVFPFQGKVDLVSIAGDLLTVRCRDLGAYLQAAAIRETVLISAGGPSAMRFGIGELFTAGGWTPGQLDVAEDPDFLIVKTPFGQTNALDAARTMAQQAGFDLRWFPPFWNARPSSFVHLYNPGRTRTVPDAIIGRGRYQRIVALDQSDADVRNDWAVYYRGPDGLPVGPFPAVDGTSVGLYGSLKAEIYVGRAENITTNAQAQAYAMFALADNKDPLVSHRVDMGAMYPHVTLNDLHRYQANGREYDRDLQLAVVGYEHTWSADPESPDNLGRTTILCRGNPIAAYTDYRLSLAPKVLVTTALATNQYAPEGTIVMPTAALP